MKTHPRVRTAAYMACMLLGAVIVAAMLVAARPSRPAHMASIYPVATAAPLMGFAADSVFNTGSEKQLDAFPGIGPVLAGRIIEGRDAYGPYRLPEDLMLVKGIGPKILSGIMEVLTEELVELPPISE